jgi:hypothetical protein
MYTWIDNMEAHRQFRPISQAAKRFGFGAFDMSTRGHPPRTDHAAFMCRKAVVPLDVIIATEPRRRPLLAIRPGFGVEVGVSRGATRSITDWW